MAPDYDLSALSVSQVEIWLLLQEQEIQTQILAEQEKRRALRHRVKPVHRLHAIERTGADETLPAATTVPIGPWRPPHAAEDPGGSEFSRSDEKVNAAEVMRAKGLNGQRQN